MKNIVVLVSGGGTNLQALIDAEKNGDILVVRPPMLLEISGIVKDPKELERVYEIGRKTGEKYLDSVRSFLAN